MYNFNEMPFIYWSNTTKLSYIQRHILIHSVIYYVRDTQVIPDLIFDDLMSKYMDVKSNCLKSEIRASQYYYCFKDFDGTTGFDLYERLKEEDKRRLDCIATNVLKMKKGGKDVTKRN